MLTPVKSIEFDHVNDYIDYVSKGFPPTKKQMVEAMNDLRALSTEDDGEEVVTMESKKFRVTNHMINSNHDDLIEVLQRVYSNQRRNMIIAGCICAGACILAGMVGFAFGVSDTKEKYEDKMNDMYLRV